MCKLEEYLRAEKKEIQEPLIGEACKKQSSSRDKIRKG